MNTKNVPALIMLLAGFVTCIVMLKHGTDNTTFLLNLLLVLVIFYIAGSVVKYVLDRNFKEEEETEEEEEDKTDQDKEDFSVEDEGEFEEDTVQEDAGENDEEP